MKKLLSLLLLVALVIGAASCNKEDDTDNDNNNNNNNTSPAMSFRVVNGTTTTEFELDENDVSVVVSEGVSVTITAFGDNNEQLILNAVGGSIAGEYNEITGCIYSEDFNESTQNPTLLYLGVPNNGNITITENNTTDRTLTGTFEMTMIRNLSGATIQVENGVFTDLSY